MKAHSRCVASLFLFACGVAGATGILPVRAGNGDTSVLPAAQRDVQDFVYLGDKRLVLIRFHVQIDGKPLGDVWEQFMDKLFAFLDRNSDGVLSKDEATGVPPVQVLFNNAPNFVGLRPSVPETLDTNRDGKITRAELDDWYRRIGATPLQMQVVPVHHQLADRPNVNPTQLLSADELNERLFSLLDADRDSKLSPDELARVPGVLHKVDLDEDEIVRIQELSEYLAGREETLASSPDSSPNNLGVNSPFIPLEPSAMRKDLARTDPDLEFRVCLSEKTTRPSVIELVRAKEKQSALSKSIRHTFGGAFILELGPTRIELGCVSRPGELGGEPQHLRREYRAQFLRSDLDSNGYLDRKEAMQTPLFRNTFRMMDRDGDGKLNEREVVAYLDKMKELQEAAVCSCVTLVEMDQGRGLFDLVDEDKDGRLSAREMRGLGRLVEQLDRDGDGRISRREIPHRYRMDLRCGPGLGNSFAQPIRIERLRILTNQAESPQRSGPLWFQKMDRNRDGEVSHREFLGAEERFRKIDQDGDGYISLEEARQADQGYRKEKERKSR